jgi:type IV secretory pathway TrbD component
MLYLGVERTVIALEATLCLALVCGAGPRLPTFVICAFVVLALHPTMVWLTAMDPIASEVYVRSRTYQDFYAPHPTAASVGRASRPSVPVAR